MKPALQRPAASDQRSAPSTSSEAAEDDEPEIAAVTATAPATDADKWKRAVDALRQASPRHGKSLSYAHFLGFSAEAVRIAFPPSASFHKAQVTGMSRAMVETELSKSLGRPVKLIEDTTSQALVGAPKSIAEVEASDRFSRERGIEDKVRSHPAVRSILRHLGGSLEHISYLEPVALEPKAGGADESDVGPVVD